MVVVSPLVALGVALQVVWIEPEVIDPRVSQKNLGASLTRRSRTAVFAPEMVEVATQVVSVVVWTEPEVAEVELEVEPGAEPGVVGVVETQAALLLERRPIQHYFGVSIESFCWKIHLW
jgi:hypothetical protein